MPLFYHKDHSDSYYLMCYLPFVSPSLQIGPDLQGNVNKPARLLAVSKLPSRD